MIVSETKVESSMMGDWDAGDVEWRFWGALPCAGSSKVAANSVRKVVCMICKVMATGSGVFVLEFDLSRFGKAVRVDMAYKQVMMWMEAVNRYICCRERSGE